MNDLKIVYLAPDEKNARRFCIGFGKMMERSNT